MATLNFFNAFKEDVFEGKHDFSTHTFKVALTNTLPVATNSVLANITEISYTNLSSRNLTVTSSSQTSGTYKAVLADLALSATGAVGPFQYVVIYNDTAAGDPLVCWYALPSAVTLASGDIANLDFDGTNGLLQAA
jgi:hypothetical protein